MDPAFLPAFNGTPIYDPIHGPGGYRSGARIARVQIAIATFLGAGAFALFCVLRKRYPRVYVANLQQRSFAHSFSRQSLPRLPPTLLGWVPVVYRVSETQVLQHAGLDAVVFLGFFKMCIRALAVLVVCAVAVISPVRYRYTGRVDVPEDGDGSGESPGATLVQNLESAFRSVPGMRLVHGPLDPAHAPEYPPYLWMYPVFTYVFTCVLLFFLHRQTVKIIRMRQQYLGRQCSVTDRTVKVLGLPPVLRDADALARHIESLGVGGVDAVCIAKEWSTLSALFKTRADVLKRLEAAWGQYFHDNGVETLADLSKQQVRPRLGDSFGMRGGQGRDIGAAGTGIDDEIDASGATGDGLSAGVHGKLRAFPAANNAVSGASRAGTSASGSALGAPLDTSRPDTHRSANTVSGILDPAICTNDPSSAATLIDRISVHLENLNLESSASPLELLQSSLLLSEHRPKLRKGIFGWCGPQIDAITHYTDQLAAIDAEIIRARRREYAPSSAAFVTMNSVAQAQVLAQAVLDPRVSQLISSLAPSPHDILWENLCLTRRQRNARVGAVMLLIGAVSVAMVLPVRFLSNFLNIESISKVAPRLAALLEAHRWAQYLVTGILPPYVFTIFNIIMPYVYNWFTRRQGHTSRADEELSSVSKNFFYIFVNLFLVFTLFGTAILTDTAQLAYQLADSLQRLSLFYVDLIILQGIGIFPYKLLLLGHLLQYPIKNLFWRKTPRNYLGLYKPPVFNFGLQLPQPMLILIITVTYSVISTKILTAGLIYFLIGYFVFKYQLLYACIHPPHNTGKVWPLVVRRVMMGLLIFHTMMFGTLASEKALACATLIVPLPIITVFLWWHFQNSYMPLSNFIALRSIENNQLPFHDEEDAHLETNLHIETLDERRELNQIYEYPKLVCDLDGPLIAVDYNEALYMQPDGTTVRKHLPIFH